MIIENDLGKMMQKFGLQVGMFILVLCYNGIAGVCSFTVEADKDNIVFQIEGYDDQLKIAEMDCFDDKYSPADSDQVWTGYSRPIVKIDRFANGRDRIYSKFALIDAGSNVVLGDYKYVTGIKDPVNGDFKLPRPKSKKGLSCIVDINDAVELGVKYIHENVHMNEFISLGSKNPEMVYEFDGLKIPINVARLQGLDARMKRFTDAGISVFVVFINQMSKDPAKRTPLVHPNSAMAKSPTHLGAFNITGETGRKYYLGILEFLTKRYTRADKKYGLISSLIVGNEVQQHWIWHNMGDMPEDDFIREYETSLRLAWLACSKFHPDVKIYVSMDHHWNKRGFNNNVLREIPGNTLLEKIAARSNANGDYPWNVAFHPYPENLFEPRFWFDKSPTDSFDTPRITFKNLQVLPRFLKQEKMLYNGKVRDIAFTEQGFHTPKGPDGEKIQAAAYAYAYYKIDHMPEVSAFILHRHVDHKGEGGLKLGLWSNNPDTADSNPWKKKYIWNVFKYADTDKWETVFEFVKPIVGIEEWGQTPKDTNPEIKSIFKVSDDSVVFDFIKEFKTAQTYDNMDCRVQEVYRAAGWLVPAIFQHPPNTGEGVMKYKVAIPEVKEGQKISLLFETILGTDKGDGVNYSVFINRTKEWSALQEGVVPGSHSIDLTKYAGKTVSIRFVVDKNKQSANDWAYWACPVLVIE